MSTAHVFCTTAYSWYAPAACSANYACSSCSSLYLGQTFRLSYVPLNFATFFFKSQALMHAVPPGDSSRICHATRPASQINNTGSSVVSVSSSQGKLAVQMLRTCFSAKKKRHSNGFPVLYFLFNQVHILEHHSNHGYSFVRCVEMFLLVQRCMRYIWCEQNLLPTFIFS